jgi:preprotein translocase subunit SecG
MLSLLGAQVEMGEGASAHLLHRDTSDVSRAGAGDGSEKQLERWLALARDAAAQSVLGRTTKQLLVPFIILLLLLFLLVLFLDQVDISYRGNIHL